MTLEFIDSFDHYATAQLTAKWTIAGATSIDSSIFRTGIGSLKVSAGTQSATKSLPNSLERTFGFALYRSGALSSNFASFMDASNVQIALTVNSSNLFQVIRGSTVLATSSQTCPVNSWVYVEFKGIIDTSGYFEVRLNGVTIISGSDNTRSTTNSYSNAIRFLGVVGINAYIDDLYIVNHLGSSNNTFLGDVKVECLVPNEPGTYTQWTPFPSGSANWSVVDEIPPDSATSYVITSGINYKDTYGFTSLTTTSGSIYGIQTNMFARKDDAGSRSIAPIFNIDGTVYSGTNYSIGNTYTYYQSIQEMNPDTLSNWTIAEINSLDSGINLVA